MKIKLSILFALGMFSVCGQLPITEGDLDSLLRSDEVVRKVLDDPTYRFQLKYSVISKCERIDQSPFTISIGEDQYFYPASTVKLPIALLTLEKIKKLNLELDDQLIIDDIVDCGNKRYIERCSSEKLTFRRLIRELIIVSDNDHYNALYHFLTPKDIMDRLSELGYNGTRIYKSFTGCDVVNQLKTNSLKVLRNGSVVYTQEASVMALNEMANCFFYDEMKLIGQKHEYDRRIVVGPFDFNYNLDIPLEELHEMMMRLFVKQTYIGDLQWDMLDKHEVFIKRTLAELPKDLTDSKFHDQDNYPNNVFKFFMEGRSGDRVMYHSKIGLSYGFTTETCYFDIPESCNDFLVSVSLYTNSNKTVNDGDYEYEEIARPVLQRIAKLLLDRMMK